MEIIELMSYADKNKYLTQLIDCKWWAGKILAKFIIEGELEKMCKANPKVFVLVDGDEVVSFCTYVHQDEIDAPDMFPWIGFVYTFEKYRSNHYFGKLLNHIISLAKQEKYQKIYVSTNENGLYEKYGFKYYKNMLDITGNDSRIYYLEIDLL